MKEIFATYPNLHLSDVFPKAVFAGFPYALGIVAMVIITLISLYYLFQSIKNKSKAKQFLSRVESVLLLSVSMLLLVGLVAGFYQVTRELRDPSGEETLEVKEIRDWYELNAPLIDKELTAKNYEYVEYEFYRIEPIGKSKIYFDSIGFHPVGLLVVDGVTQEGEIEKFNVYIDIVQENHKEKNKTLKLKYTSEFGEAYDIGKGVYYGELYVNEFELMKLSTTSKQRFR